MTPKAQPKEKKKIKWALLKLKFLCIRRYYQESENTAYRVEESKASVTRMQKELQLHNRKTLT